MSSAERREGTLSALKNIRLWISGAQAFPMSLEVIYIPPLGKLQGSGFQKNNSRPFAFIRGSI
jgi:hypothetical protein